VITIKAVLTISCGFILIGALGRLLIYGLEEAHDLIPAIIIALTFVIFGIVNIELFRIGIKSLRENKIENGSNMSEFT